MSVSRLAAVLLVVVALVATTGSATADPAAPTGLHGFLLRADEPTKTSFSRTPAFAWNPVSGAGHYEFQLSTSNTFRENGQVWEDNALTSPVAAPLLTLPWITGSPHSLYARVRAFLSGGSVTPWSDDYGFDMTPPAPPAPLPAAPGLLRWTPVEGADSYDVWLLEPNKHEIVRTNVLDEREYYTFHQTSNWISSLHWRIRALRTDVPDRLNGIPATHFGAWSTPYSSTNPAFSGGQIHLGSTISDVVSNGDPASLAQRLMPGFTWTGNQALDGTPAELFRVEVFTDRQCLNRVFTGAVVGSPAYAPRPHGPLALPAVSVATARASYLQDGAEPAASTFDGSQVTPNEMLSHPTATLTPPAEPGAKAGGSGASSGGSGASSGGSGASSGDSGASSGGGSGLAIDLGTADAGAPVNVWDTNWPQGGYYWTVIPIEANTPGELVTSIAPPGGLAGVTSLPVTNSDGFAVGDTVKVGSGGNAETGLTVIGVDAGSLTFSAALKSGHGAGEPVVRDAGAGALRYEELELPQDVCAPPPYGPNRVARFGKESEPSLTSGGDAFASGLSPTGRLTSATNTSPSFYGAPVISWTPALGATVYQIQWSKTKYPFIPETSGTGDAGVMTAATSYVLPLAPGTWYYRVRGFDFLLPTDSQMLSWSDAEKITIAKPTFTVVGGDTGSTSTKTAAGMRTYDKGSFSIAVPKTWRELNVKDSVYLFVARDQKVVDGFRANLNVLQGSGRNGRTMAQWASDLRLQVKPLATGSVSAKVVNMPAGQAVQLSYRAKLKSGKVLGVLQYAYDTGTQAYFVTFTATALSAKAYAKTFRAEAASFSAN